MINEVCFFNAVLSKSRWSKMTTTVVIVKVHVTVEWWFLCGGLIKCFFTLFVDYLHDVIFVLVYC